LGNLRRPIVRALEDHVLNMKAVTHDYILLGLNLKTDDEYLGVG
jgi:hypothetical protein